MRALEAADVAAWVRDELLNPARAKPVVAVTTRAGGGRLWVDPEALDRELGDRAQVVLLETGEATWELSDALPDRLDVYGGALRVWWPGLREDADPYDHPLLFVPSPQRALTVFGRIIELVTGEQRAVPDDAVQRASPEDTAAPRPSPKPSVLVTVESIGERRVSVTGDDYVGEVRYADVPLWALRRCVEVGTQFRARPVRPVGLRWELSTQGVLPVPWDIAVRGLQVDSVVVGKVRELKPYGALVDLLPRVWGLVHISEIDWSYVSDVREFVQVGTLVKVQVMRVDPEQRRIELSLKRAYGASADDLPSLVPGGLPFTWPAEDLGGDDDPEQAPEAAAEDGARHADEKPVVAEQGARAGSLTRSPIDEAVADLQTELEAAHADRASLRRRVNDLKKQLRASEDRQHRMERQFAGELDPTGSERAFLLGVRLAYARLLDEGSRQRYPLQRMRVGPDFLESLRSVDGIETDKVLEVCAQVAANMAHELAAREVHQLRTGSRGSGSHVRERDQAQAWRCALQIKSPSARRLHWWAVPGDDGAIIEFANVVLHDDYSITH